MTPNGMITWSPGVSLEQIEKQVILKAFQHYRGNKTQTAIGLGISIRTLDNKLEIYSKGEKSEELIAIEQQRRDDEFVRRSRGPSRGPDGSVSAHALADYERGDDPLELTAQGEESDGASIESESDLQGDAGASEDSYAFDDSSDEGARVESAPRDSEKRVVPLPKRKKVQKVSSRKTGQVRHAQGRR